MTLTAHEAAEILEHWQAGEGIKPGARILRRGRDTIRRYVRAAQEQGYRPGAVAPTRGWRAWVVETFPELRRPPAFAGDGGRELEWEEYVAVAQRFKWRAEAQDRDDLGQDIIVRLAEVARRYEGEDKPFTRWTMLRVARITVFRYWHERSRHRKVVSLSTVIVDDGKRPIELWETLAGDRAIDLDDWIDVGSWLDSAPQRLVKIIRKTANGIPLEQREKDYLKQQSNKVKGLLFGQVNTDRDERIRQVYLEGKGIKQIAREFHHTRQTVRNAIYDIRAPVSSPPKGA